MKNEKKEKKVEEKKVEEEKETKPVTERERGFHRTDVIPFAFRYAFFNAN